MEPQLYDVTLVGFPRGTSTGEPPTRAMQRLFEIDEGTAQRFLSSTPITVKHDATAEIARTYGDPLRALGAEVVIKPASSSSTPPPPQSRMNRQRETVDFLEHGNVFFYDSGFEAEPTKVSPPPVPVERRSPPPVPSAVILDGVGIMPSPPTPVPQGRRPSPPHRESRTPLRYSEPVKNTEKEKGFLASIPSSFLLPLRGTGKWWMVAATILTLGASVLGLVGQFMPIVGLVLQLFLVAGLLTVCAKFYQSCMASGAYGEKSPGPLPEMMHFIPDFVVPGFALTLWFALASFPLLGWLSHAGATTPPAELVTHPLTILFAVTPYVIWPIALAHATASGSFFSLWNFPAFIMSISRAPFRYGVVLAAGVAAAFLPMFIAGMVAYAAGTIGAVIGMFIAAGSMAYSHAVMGALMGHLARTKPEVLPD